MRYELAYLPFMGDEQPPFAIVTVDADGTVTSIEPHPTADEAGFQSANHLINNFEDDPASFPLNRLAASYGSLKKIGESVGEEGALRLFIAFASTGFGRDGDNPGSTTPVAAVLAQSKDDVAVEAISFSDSLVGAYIAGLFLRGIPGAEVASTHLSGFLTKDPNLIYFTLLRLPAKHPVFALVTKAEGWEDHLVVRQPKQPRRVARRG